MAEIQPCRIKSETHREDLERTAPHPRLPPPSPAFGADEETEVHIHHTAGLPTHSPALSFLYHDMVPLANPYICAHHGVLSETLMTKAIFHRRV